MRQLIGVTELLIGLAYTGLGVLTVYEMLHERRTRGRSQFGMAFAFMAFTCGPHHLLRAGATFSAPGRASTALVAALLIGLPPGVIFIGLRIEALRGGSGDRMIRYAAFAPTVAVIVAVASGAIIAGALRSHAPIDPLFAISNSVLIASYLAVGWYILNTQFRRYLASRSWSLSGVALGFIFPTCAVIHLAHVLGGHAHAQLSVVTHTLAGHVHHWTIATPGHVPLWSQVLVVLDTAGLPASVWFLVVVRRLYREGLADWNRRPLVGTGLTPRRIAPWEYAPSSSIGQHRHRLALASVQQDRASD